MQAIQNEDGRLELFARGWDGALSHVWQVDPGGAWSDWDSLGVPHPEFRSPDGKRSYGFMLSTPAVARNADGRLEVFAIGLRDSFHIDLVHIWQLAANSGPWSSWASLNGRLKDVAPTVGRNADGRLEVFACFEDNALWHIWQTAPNNGWSDWHWLGGVILGGPVVVENADGRLEVFVRGSDWQLWHIWQTSPNGGVTLTDWSGWASLGGNFLLSAPVVSSNFDGRLEVFGSVYPSPWPSAHIWQRSPNVVPTTYSLRVALGKRSNEAVPSVAALIHSHSIRKFILAGGGWSQWADLPVEQFWESPSVGQNADGRLEIFGTPFWLGPLIHQWQTWPDLTWAEFTGTGSADFNLGGLSTSTPVVIQNADGRLEVFARGSDYKVYHIWQSAPNSGWSDWERIGDHSVSDLGRSLYDESGMVRGNG